MLVVYQVARFATAALGAVLLGAAIPFDGAMLVESACVGWMGMGLTMLGGAYAVGR